MKALHSLALLAGLLAASSDVFAQDESGRPSGRRAPSPVKVEMEKLEEAVDAVAAFLKKPEGDAPMTAVAAAQAALQSAKQHAPRTAMQKPEGERAAFVVEYKLQVNKTLRALLDLEDAMLAKDWKAAQKANEALGELQKAGHRKFKPRRRRRGN